MKRPAPPASSEPDFPGKYKIVREVSRSGASILYEAVGLMLGRRVAIKVLDLPGSLDGTQKQDRIERFANESKALVLLVHPNIVTIYEVGQNNDRYFSAMEYLEGHSLGEIEQMQGALPVKESLEITLQAGDALSYAHSRGVIHQNISHHSIFILPGGIIKITNFEHTRITTEPSATADSAIFKSPASVSPERLASQPVDHRTDIFSLGAVLYEMLAGHSPFVGDVSAPIDRSTVNLQAPALYGISDGVNAVLQRALAKDPIAGYQTMEAMCADVRAEKLAL